MDELDEFLADPGASRRLNVLYLVAELEAAIELGGIAWTAEDAALPDRVANLLSALRGQSTGANGRCGGSCCGRGTPSSPRPSHRPLLPTPPASARPSPLATGRGVLRCIVVMVFGLADRSPIRVGSRPRFYDQQK
jgi:hypothetical protein